MSVGSYAQRSLCAARLQQLKDSIAARVTEQFLAAHPDWLQKYGDRAPTMGIQDAAFHVDFLSGAIETGSTRAFAEYSAWSRRVLQSRGIAPAFLDENLRQIAHTAGALLPEFAVLVAEFVDAGRSALRSPETAPGPPDAATLSDVRRLFTEAAIRGDRRGAVGLVLETVRQGTPPVDIYTRVFEPSQLEIGRRWEANELTVAEEHVGTAVTQYVMARVFGDFAAAAPTRGRVIVTGVAGEYHQIAANMVADVLALDGWDVRFLGSNVPQRDIVEEVRAFRPVILAISATMLFNAPRVVALVRAVRGELPDTAPRIIVGGAAFRNAAAFAEELGCDGVGTDLRSARELAVRLAPRVDTTAAETTS